MTWFKVDDSLPDSPDVLALEESKHFLPAMGLWVLAGAWCAKHLTDGAVSHRVIRKLGGKKVVAEALVSAGLWEATEGGYQFRNWLKYQPSREDVQASREAAAERMRRKRSRERSPEQTPHVLAGARALPGPTDPGPTDPGPTVPPNPRTCSPESSTPEPERVTWQRIGALFAERYLRATTRPLALHLHQAAFEAVALESGGDLEAVERSLEAYWADPWAQEHGWPPAAWAKQFGRHLDGPRKPPDPVEQARRDAAAADAALAEAKRQHDERYREHLAREAERSRERAKARQASQGSAPPPRGREGPSGRGGEPKPLGAILGGLTGGE